MQKDNDALSLYCAQRERARRVADDAMTKAVASVKAKAKAESEEKSGKKTTVSEVPIAKKTEGNQKDTQPPANPVK